MIRICTRDLVGHLTDLAHTAADPSEAGPTAAILLHSTTGHFGARIGASSLLVGTSTDGEMVGHTYATCGGSTTPMLWPIADVRAVIAVLKPLGKDPNHVVEIGRDGDVVRIAEDPNLLGEGLTVTFGSLNPDDFPTEGVRRLLEDPQVAVGGGVPEALPRTDFEPTSLAPFLKVASRRGELLQTFRYHQRLAVSVQVGDTYRGALRPFQWEDTVRDAGLAPSADVYPLVLDGVPA